MTVKSRAGGAVVIGALLVGAVQYNSWRHQQPGRADGAGTRYEPVALVAVWDTNRDMNMTWTANGARPPAEIDPISPWEKNLTVRPGGTVTFTVRPLIGGAGAHHCMIEHPPGVPLPGHAQKTGYGTTPITCTAVIGA